MIKLIAAALMLLDHIGWLLLPETVTLRIIGRLSMPLFAFSVARGFYYSQQHGTTKRYIKNMTFFALFSQIPYGAASHMTGTGIALNIGFTWLLALFLLLSASQIKPAGIRIAAVVGVMLLSVLLPVDYGIYGVLFPAVFFFSFYRFNRPSYSFYGMCLLFLIYLLLKGKVGTFQIFSLASYPLLILTLKSDAAIKIPKRLFYWFYPVHLWVLVAIKFFTNS